MKYIIACLFSLGAVFGAFAQDTGDTTGQQQNSDVITCVYLDENTITCFNPEEMENPEFEGEQQDTSTQELFEEGEARGREEEYLEETEVEEGATREEELLEAEEDQRAIEREQEMNNEKRNAPGTLNEEERRNQEMWNSDPPRQ